jgi:adenine-specific DNA-methyltransferase
LDSQKINQLSGEGRRLCQFTTPDVLAEIMARWAITSADDVVLDPCCGNSNLLEKAMDRLISLGATPRKAARQTYGIEISPRTAGIATATLLNKYGPSLPKVVTADFLRTKSGTIPLVGAIVCNPPYKRHQDLGKKYKAEITSTAYDENGTRLAKTSNQYVYFLLHALAFLKESGRMVFLLPSQYLTNGFGGVLRDYLARNVTITHVILFDERLPVFPNSMSTASLILIENLAPSYTSNSTFVKLDSVSAIADLLGDQVSQQNAAATVRTVPQSALVGSGKWIGFFTRKTIPDGAKTLSDLAEVSRGIATGANDFFFLNDSDVKTRGLPEDILRPVLIRAHDAPFPDFGKWDWTRLRRRGKRVWMLETSVQKHDLKNSNLLQYIEWGEEMKYHKRYLTSRRNPWYRTEKRRPAPILFTYMSNGSPRFIYNKAGILTSNAFHSIYPSRDTTSDKIRLKALLAFLNSSHIRSRLALVGRTYSGGLLKLEPSETEGIPVDGFESLDRVDLAKLARLFDKLCLDCRIAESWDTDEIDRLIRSKLSQS